MVLHLVLLRLIYSLHLYLLIYYLFLLYLLIYSLHLYLLRDQLYVYLDFLLKHLLLFVFDFQDYLAFLYHEYLYQNLYLLFHS